MTHQVRCNPETATGHKNQRTLPEALEENTMSQMGTGSGLLPKSHGVLISRLSRKRLISLEVFIVFGRKREGIVTQKRIYKKQPLAVWVRNYNEKLQEQAPNTLTWFCQISVSFIAICKPINTKNFTPVNMWKHWTHDRYKKTFQNMNQNTYYLPNLLCFKSVGTRMCSDSAPEPLPGKYSARPDKRTATLHLQAKRQHFYLPQSWDTLLYAFLPTDENFQALLKLSWFLLTHQ